MTIFNLNMLTQEFAIVSIRAGYL